MKALTILFLLFFLVRVAYTQEAATEQQMFVGCDNVGEEEEVTHYIEAFGSVWEKDDDDFVISSDPDVYDNSVITIGNADFEDIGNWPGFNFSWETGGTEWGLGLYKVTNSLTEDDNYFYLDARDSDFGAVEYNPDFCVFFDDNSEVYKYFEPGEGQHSLTNGELIGIWDIKGESPNTSGLQNYWSNVLVILTDGNNPRLVWGPHPTFSADYYYIYRAISSTPLAHPAIYASYIDQVSGSIYEYNDTDIGLTTNGDYVYYFVKGYNGSYSGPSNIEMVRGYMYKENISSKDHQNLKFSLYQNYPNPFNPLTEINYTVAENSFVSLRIYDVLGNIVSDLVNEVKEAGDYSVSFDASELSSGIYFYTLRANNYTSTRKMLLTK